MQVNQNKQNPFWTQWDKMTTDQRIALLKVVFAQVPELRKQAMK